MQLTRPKTPGAPASPGPRPRAASPAAATAPGLPGPRPPRRGLEDRALYSCECGFAWTGEVTASPGCPHCGTPQAW